MKPHDDLEFQSEHFNKIWKLIIIPAIDSCFNELDPDFLENVKPTKDSFGKKRRQIEKDYRALREQLKKDCYGDCGNGCLDDKKIGAIICFVLIKNKPVTFSLSLAKDFALEKKNTLTEGQYNTWAANNILVNYKIAFVASQYLVYWGTKYCLEKKDPALGGINDQDCETILKKLKNKGRLARYPLYPNFDSFGVNLIVALARTDFRGYNIDIQLFALQLWQMQMYTLELLKNGDES